MRRSVTLAVAAVLALSSVPLGAVAQEPSAYTAALADSVRTPGDRERDERRHSAETLAFAQVRPGQKVVDMIMGGGYFTRLLSAAVGPEGFVTAWQPQQFITFDPSYGEAATMAHALVNVDTIQSSIDGPAFPATRT